MKKSILSKMSVLSALSFMLLAGCTSKTDKIVLEIGFWPETTEAKDLNMYNEWKANFERDYPQYEIVGKPYKYSPDTIGGKVMTNTLPTVFQTWFTEPQKLVNNKYMNSFVSYYYLFNLLSNY